MVEIRVIADSCVRVLVDTMASIALSNKAFGQYLVVRTSNYSIANLFLTITAKQRDVSDGCLTNWNIEKTY